VAGAVAASALGDVLLPKHLPAGVFLEGLVVGGLSSFTAMGLILVYRSARIINFAQYAIGALAGSFAVLGVASWGLDWYLSVVIGMAVAVACGWLVDRIVIGRLQAAPRLIVTVATIGVLQIFAFAQGEVPNLGGTLKLGANVFHGPLSVHFAVGPLLFTGDHVIAMAAVPLVLGALWWFLERTDLGMAVRGAADSNERAVLLGVPVRRVSAVVWVTAAALSGIGAILSAPITHNSFLGAASGPEDLLPALVAAVLAGFESLPVAVGASLAIGVIQQAVLYSYAQSSTTDIILFALVVVGLLLRRKGLGDSRGFGDYVQVRAVRPVPAVLARLPEVRVVKVVGGLVVLVAVVFVPLATSPADLGLLALIAIFAVVAVSLVVLTGWAGQISLGQFAFVGVGTATTGALLVHAGADLFVALLVSAAVGAAVACAIGLPALRRPGLSLAAVTMAFAVPVSTFLLSSAHVPFLNPTDVLRPGLFDRFPLTSPGTFYELCLAFLVLSMLMARNFRRSRVGRAVVSVRDNPRAAASYGVSPLRAKLIAFAFAGALAAVAGGLYIVDIGSAGTSIDPQTSLSVFAMVVIGGLGSLFGAVLGAVYVESVLYFLPPQWQLLASGAGLLVLLLVLPEGLGGAIYLLRDKLLASLARRRGITLNVPAEPADALPSTTALRVSAQDVTNLTGSPFGAQLAGPEGLWVTTAVIKAVDLPPDNKRASVDGGPPPGTAVAVSLRGADVYIGSAQILSDVTFGVAPGEIVALLGTNGAGKSTTLRTLAGLLRPSPGDVVLEGRVVTDRSCEQRVRQGVVMVPGGRGVFPSLTVEQNLRLAEWVGRRHHREGMKAARKRVDELFPRLAERRHVRAGLLSGGEQQMLALALGLLGDVKVLMIDELSLGLAPTVVAELLEVVRRLADEGVAVIVVEQSVPVAASLARRAVLMDRGRVYFNGPPGQLLGDGFLRSAFLGHAVVPVPARNGARRRLPTAGAPALEVRGISKQFGGVAALTDVSLAVAPGEVLGLIGSNGAGKTTLLDVCSGFLLPDQGRVELFGVDVTARSPNGRAVAGLGRSFQDARLFPSMTVEETLATAFERHTPVRDPFLALWWTSAVEQSERVVADRAAALLADMGLETYRDRFISELSTGVRRIVELACALAHRPDVLLLDEPAAGVAHQEVAGLGKVLRSLSEETGMAVLVIEHDVPLVAGVADRLVCLHLGEVIAEGSPADVLASADVVSSFLGEPEPAALIAPGR
jgi:ABC-type branched-subunit amino acid transport system ATPase component/ABC-type branched-subunit amino acid transport system permease subunit